MNKQIEEAKYFYLVKNLRGVIYFSSETKPEAELEWLKKKFRYRELGVSEALKLEKNWKKLFPLEAIEEDPVLDSVLQASRFISPLIILKESSLADYEKAIIVCLKIKDGLSDKELKFNLRLVNYSITDFFLKSIEMALKGDLAGRKDLAAKDLKRFWRLSSHSEGKPFIVYLDPLLIRRNLREATLMSLIPCLVLDLDISLGEQRFFFPRSARR